MGSSGDRLCQTNPIPRSPDGDKKSNENYVGIWIGSDNDIDNVEA